MRIKQVRVTNMLYIIPVCRMCRRFFDMFIIVCIQDFEGNDMIYHWPHDSRQRRDTAAVQEGYVLLPVFTA